MLQIFFKDKTYLATKAPSLKIFTICVNCTLCFLRAFVPSWLIDRKLYLKIKRCPG
jgi:hypothetical protein